MAKAAATAKSAGERVPRKGKQTHGGGPDKGAPKKGRTDKYCKWCRAVDGPFTTHNTTGNPPQSVVGSIRTAAKRTG